MIVHAMERRQEVMSATSVGKLAGPFLVGTFLSWGFLGVLTMQIYLYSAGCHDSRWIRGIIYLVYFLEFVQTVVISQIAFQTFAYGFGDVKRLNEFGALWFAVPVLSGFVAFIAQTVYAYRVRVLSRRNWLPAIILSLAITQLGGAIATGVDTRRAVNISQFFDKNTFVGVGIWSGGSAICDVIIAASMTYYLTRLDSGVRQTTNLLRRLIRLIIGTGTLTAAIATFNLIVALLPGHPTYYQASSISLGKVYSVSMLVVFNSRISFGLERVPNDRFDMPVVSIEFEPRASSNQEDRKLGSAGTSSGSSKVRTEKRRSDAIFPSPVRGEV